MMCSRLVFLFALTLTVHSEVFTAITDLEDILQNDDRVLIEILDEFMKQEENRFNLLKE
jgi:hypothetical protein